MEVGSDSLKPPSSSAEREGGLKEGVGPLTDFGTLLPVLQATDEMGDVVVDLPSECASVGFYPIFHLFVAAPWPEFAGECNGEFLEGVLHFVDLIDTRCCQPRMGAS
jgi:hypothetical protein